MNLFLCYRKSSLQDIKWGNPPENLKMSASCDWSISIFLQRRMTVHLSTETSQQEKPVLMFTVNIFSTLSCLQCTFPLMCMSHIQDEYWIYSSVILTYSCFLEYFHFTTFQREILNFLLHYELVKNNTQLKIKAVVSNLCVLWRLIKTSVWPASQFIRLRFVNSSNKLYFHSHFFNKCWNDQISVHHNSVFLRSALVNDVSRPQIYHLPSCL